MEIKTIMFLYLRIWTNRVVIDTFIFVQLCLKNRKIGKKREKD